MLTNAKHCNSDDAQQKLSAVEKSHKHPIKVLSNYSPIINETWTRIIIVTSSAKNEEVGNDDEESNNNNNAILCEYKLLRPCSIK